MGLQEQARRPEWTLELDQWVEEVKKRWEKAPEFRADPEKLRHLAIICDGNRRAAKGRGLPSYLGHRAGIEAIKGIARAARKWDIHTLTFWVWSTENWQRDREQVEFVMELAKEFLPQDELLQELLENNARFTHLGRRDRLPQVVVDAMDRLEAKTASNNNYRLNLALDYGGADEIARAVIKMQEAGLDPKTLLKNPRRIFEFLDAQGQPEPDLVIRTGFKKDEIFRTSGFMPLQTAYSGWIPISVFFPDLTARRLMGSIKKFQGYERRRGV